MSPGLSSWCHVKPSIGACAGWVTESASRRNLSHVRIAGASNSPQPQRGVLVQPRATPWVLVTHACENPERRTKTLKGWNNLIPPLQGSRCVGPNRLPGRCPGLSCCALSGRSGEPARGSRDSNTQRRSSPPKVSWTLPFVAVRQEVDR